MNEERDDWFTVTAKGIAYEKMMERPRAKEKAGGANERDMARLEDMAELSPP
jgi:hypothetical protein